MTPSIKGTFVTHSLPYDNGRNATVYIPPLPPELIIYTGDGQSLPQYITALEAAADLSPTITFAAHRAEDETQRLHEYSPTLSPDRFAAHEKFFVEHIPAWARSRFKVSLSAKHTTVFGVCAGGELALAMGLRHPDKYGSVLCASPGGGYRPPDMMSSVLPRVYLVAGTLEPFLLENARQGAGYCVA